ncbi:MAG: diaminopimelate epimerase [Ilumatobacteraceae bacterium]
MDVLLTKHHGLENDFLVYNLAQGEPATAWPDLARRWCHRSTGIGADGLLLLSIADDNQLTMRLYNADGSVAEMSGNGIRCLVQAAHGALQNGTGATYHVRTDAGMRDVTVVEQEDVNTLLLSVDMGVVSALSEPDNWAALECDPMRPVSHLSLGNPHSVVGVEDVSIVDLQRLGELVPHVNLEIVEPGPGTNAITMRVHERGAGITRACGTGACAAADAALRWGLVPASVRDVIVHMDGGMARVHISPESVATLIGPAVHIATVLVSV